MTRKLITISILVALIIVNYAFFSTTADLVYDNDLFLNNANRIIESARNINYFNTASFQNLFRSITPVRLY
jgi:hypothetical protein